jgi:thioredoxin reductase (NADPH)
MTQNQSIHDNYIDIAIIGAGPTGMFAAFYAGMRQMSARLIESLPQVGGQLSALYPEKYIYDVAGFPKILAQDLVNNLQEQMRIFDTEICLDERVLKIDKTAEGFAISTSKQQHFAKTVLITAGCGAFEPRKLTVPEAARYEDRNLHYFVKDLHAFEGKNVVLFGGGDSAVDWALMLEPIANVTLVHRRDTFRAHEHSVENLKNSRVNILTPYELKALHGDDKIEQVTLYHNKNKAEITIDVDAVIVNFGFVSSLGPIKDWGLDIEANAIVVNSKQETNIPGIYAAGDICTYPGKINLIATGFGEAPTAISNAKNYIDPSVRIQPGHSSNMNLG